MAKEYIERKALEKQLNERLRFLHKEYGHYDHYTDGYDEAVDTVENEPSADVVEVVHGEWEKRTFIIFDSEKVGYRCSECNTTWDTQTPYCPNCGAKMDGEREDNG